MSGEIKYRQMWIDHLTKRPIFTDEDGNDHDILNAIGLSKRVELSTGLDCPNCDNVGYTPHQTSDNDWEQEQCEFCYEVPESVFNRMLALNS